MQRFNGRFQEVIDYKNRPHKRVSFEKRSQHIYFLDENNLTINCMQFLSNDIFIYSKWHSTYSEQRDRTMHKVVTYKRLKTIEMPNVIPRSACGGLSIKLWEVAVYERFYYGALKGKFWCFDMRLLKGGLVASRGGSTWRYKTF